MKLLSEKSNNKIGDNEISNSKVSNSEISSNKNEIINLINTG